MESYIRGLVEILQRFVESFMGINFKFLKPDKVPACLEQIPAHIFVKPVVGGEIFTVLGVQVDESMVPFDIF